MFKRAGGNGVQNHQSCLVSDKYRTEVALKVDTVKDQGVRGSRGSTTPGTPLASLLQ